MVIGLVCGLLPFTPSPFVDLGTLCCGELGSVSAAGMKGWVDLSVLIGDGCSFYVVGSACDIFCICVCVCGCGCGGTTGCGDNEIMCL